MDFFATQLTKHPKSVLLVILILMLASIWPVSQIETDFSLEGFFPKDAKTIVEYQRFINDYGRDDNIIAILIQHEDVFTPALLDVIEITIPKIEAIYGVESTLSLLNAESLQSENDNLITSAWVQDRDLLITKRDSLLSSWSNDPFLSDLIVNRDGTVTGLYLTLEPDIVTYTNRQKIIDELEPLLAPLREVSQIYITGIPYFRNMYVNRLNDQIVFYITVSSLLILLVLWFLYYNWRDVLVPICIVWVTILFTIAIFQLTGGYFEIMSSIIAPILLCVGIADSIHVMSKYNDELIHGSSPDNAIRQSIVTLGTATLLTSLTTALGFATLATNNILPMRNFGLYTAAGVMIAFLVTIIALPAILKLTGSKVKTNKKKDQIHNFVGNWLYRLDDFIYAHHRAVLVTGVIITILISLGAYNLKVNSYIFDDVGKDSDLLEASQFASDNLTPQFPLEIVISTGVEGGVHDPNLLARLDSMHHFLEEFSEFRKVISLATLMRETHSLVDPIAADSIPLPQTSDRIAQYQLLLELTGSSAFSSFTDFDYSEVRISIMTEDMGSYRMNIIRSSIDSAIVIYFPTESVMITGSNILLSDITQNFVSSLTWSILLAITFIGLLMWALFKNLSLTILSIIPNILPLLVTAGIMGYFEIWIKPSTAVIFTIAFGIAVDDTIHYLARLRLEAAKSNDFRSIVRITTEKTGRAMILTSVVLLTGFGTLAFSEFDSTSIMGSLVSLTISTAVVADLVFLPALLYWIKPNLESFYEPTASQDE
jgi:predicted RND superfamily exporter protein